MLKLEKNCFKGVYFALQQTKIMLIFSYEKENVGIINIHQILIKRGIYYVI